MQHILIKKGTSAAAAFAERLRATPVILAVKSHDGLEKSLAGTGNIVFVLFGSVLTIPGIVAQLKAAGKTVLVHFDLLDGLDSSDAAVDFLAANTAADGILSTKANLLKRAKSQGLITVQRFFVLDSLALITIEKQFPLEYADAVEILPGIMPKVIRKLAGGIGKPIIAGGLVSDREDVLAALNAGAVAVSTTNAELLNREPGRTFL